MIDRRILFVMMAVCFAAVTQQVLAQQSSGEAIISLDGINLNLGMQKTEVMNLLGKKYLLQHYGGKEDIWRVFRKGGKYPAGTSGSMTAQVTFKDNKICAVWKDRGDDIASLLSVLEEYNKQGLFMATIKTEYLGHVKSSDGNGSNRIANIILMDFGKKRINVVVDTFKGKTDINQVAENLRD